MSRSPAASRSGSDIGVIGGGSWGTALAIVLARQRHQVALWVYERDLAETIAARRENPIYLPGFTLDDAILPTSCLAEAVAPLMVIAVPSHALRHVLLELRPSLNPSAEIVLATKGLEEGSLLRVSEVALEVLGEAWAPRLATLSGPTFAREIAAGEPAAVLIAARDAALAGSLQQRLASPALRLYTSSDVVGVEIAASLKNVIALAAGICQGLGMGSNTRAALIARGLAEMSRLALALGGRAETLAGLAGLGDLVLTCTGDLSRNRALGIALGQGKTLEQAQTATPMVAEGVHTTAAGLLLARRMRVEMPILEQMHRVLFEHRSPRAAVADLMRRDLKPE